MPFYFHYRGVVFDTDPDPMVGMFVKDITAGIADTGVKAGIIKCATDRDGLTPGVERVLRACARTHRETGVPITPTPTPARSGVGTSSGCSRRRAWTSPGSSSATRVTRADLDYTTAS